jgi:hypothetical protein
MNYLAFTSGLLLPWLAGATWLAVAELPVTRPAPGRVFRWLGYGFFLGYALLYGVMAGFDEVTGSVPYRGVMAVLLAVASLGALILWRAGKRPAEPPTAAGWLLEFRRLGPGARALLVLLLIWVALHVALAAVEIFLRPVYPWDAWQTWIYRAKAWFFTDGMADLVSREEWLRTDRVDAYTTSGYHYPGLPSAIPYWAALSLRSWSETLVNIPVLLCSGCIGLALYGQLRVTGVSLLLSVLAVFVLWSTPIFGVHAALGGYADIWMAGFAGLGFVALIAGLGARQLPQLVLGLLMLVLGMLVKEEAVVWLYAALLAIAIVVLPTRVLLGSLAVLVIAGVVAGIGGTTYIDLPLVGVTGLKEARLFIPFVGPIALQAHDVGPAYIQNFLAMGSWNLLWALLLIALVAAIWPPRNGQRRAALVFLLVFAATQIFIFGFTDRGLYAGSYTAINRLPLQFLPALVFALTLIARSRVSLPFSIKWPRILVAAALSAVAVTVGLAILIWKELPRQAPEPLTFAPSQLQFAMGEGSEDGRELRITGYSNGFALVSSGPVRIDADSLSLLHYSAHAGEGAESPAFFWRRAGLPGDVVRLDVPPGEGSVDLSTAAGWSGEVTEVGFLFAEPGQGTARLGSFLLEAPTVVSSLQTAASGWFRFEPWSQRAINFLYGGARKQSYPLPLLLAAWMLLAVALVWLHSRLSEASWATSIILLSMAAWMVLDVRWTANSYQMASATVARFGGLSAQKRQQRAMDGPLYKYIEGIKIQSLGAQPVRLVVVGDLEGNANLIVKRARYHLLPHNARITSRLTKDYLDSEFDYVLFIDHFSGLSMEEISVRLPLDEEWRTRLRGISRHELGILFSVVRGE